MSKLLKIFVSFRLGILKKKLAKQLRISDTLHHLTIVNCTLEN